MSRPIVPPAEPSAQLPSPELPGPGEPEELAAPRAALLPPIPRPPPRPKLPRATTEHPPEPAATADRTPLPELATRPGALPSLYPRLPEPPDTAQLPAVDLDLASSRLRARGTPRVNFAPGEQIRALVFAPGRRSCAPRSGSIMCSRRRWSAIRCSTASPAPGTPRSPPRAR